ncbi:hypothetical protein G0Y44_10250 [Staphylococcus aureus]|nr:hypothetical protein [Staphylococcus aureus]
MNVTERLMLISEMMGILFYDHIISQIVTPIPLDNMI